MALRFEEKKTEIGFSQRKEVMMEDLAAKSPDLPFVTFLSFKAIFKL